MTKATSIVAFLQERASERQGKPSISDILGVANSPREALALISIAHPNATEEEVRAAVEERVEILRREGKAAEAEARAMRYVDSLVARDRQHTEETTLGETLQRLANQGDRGAEAILLHLNNPVRRAEEVWLDQAVALDPYWNKIGAGRYHCKQGALHDTPEKLLAAYLEKRGEAAFDDLPSGLKRAVLEILEQANIGQMVAGHSPVSGRASRN